MAAPFGSPGAIGEPRPNGPRFRRPGPTGSPGAIGEPGLRPGAYQGEQGGPGDGSLQRAQGRVAPKPPPSYTPEEVAQRRARYANRQREYSRSNTQATPYTVPSGNPFVQ